MRVLVAVVCFALACTTNIAPPTLRPDSPTPTPVVRTADLGAYFDRPPDFPGYAWTYQGQRVDTTHGMNTIAGPGHCGWEAATLMHLPWPPGTNATSAADIRQFVRDARRVVPQWHLRGSLDLHAALPADAIATGYRFQDVEVYVSPTNTDAVYVVGASAVERWPRSDPMTLCS